MPTSIDRNEPNMLARPTEDKSILGLILSWFLAFLFGFGALFVVLFFFLPIIDQASIARQYARIDAGERQQDRLDAKLWGHKVAIASIRAETIGS